MKKSTIKKLVINLVIIPTVLFILVLALIPVFVMNDMLNKKITYSKVWLPEEFGIESVDTLRLKSSDDYTVEVFAVEAETPKCAIICLTGIKVPSVTIYYGHSKMFLENSYSSFLTEVRGHGGSSGDRICAGYQEWRDVKAVTDHIKAQPKYENIPIVVLGLSMGGAIAINSTGLNDDIDALISISAYSAWEDIFCEGMSQSAPSFIVSLDRPFVNLVSALKYDVNSWKIRPKSLVKAIAGRRALIMHTKGDSQVGYSNFERIIKEAPDGVETFVREGDNHFFATDFVNPQNDSTYCQRVNMFIKNVVIESTHN